MSKIALNLKEFKHLKTDKHATTLQHKDGHILTLSHGALSPESQEQLKAMAPKEDPKALKAPEGFADGGPALGSTTRPDKGWGSVTVVEADGGEIEAPYTGNVPQAARQDYQANTTEKRKKETEQYGQPLTNVKEMDCSGGMSGHYAEGGGIMDTVKKLAPVAIMAMADGGDVPQTEDTPAPMPAPTEAAPQVVAPVANKEVAQQPIDSSTMRMRQLYNNQVAQTTAGADPTPFMFGDKGQPPTSFDAQVWDKAQKEYASEQALRAQDAAAAQQQAIKTNASRVQAGLAPLPVPNVPQDPQMPGSMMNQPPPNQPNEMPKTNQEAQGAPDPMQQYGDMLMKGMNAQLAGVEQGAQAQGALGQAQAKQYQQAAAISQNNQETYKKTYDTLEQERQHIMSDINEGHINPEQYWTGDKDGNGGHSKIMAGIGMIIVLGLILLVVRMLP